MQVSALFIFDVLQGNWLFLDFTQRSEHFCFFDIDIYKNYFYLIRLSNLTK